MVDHIVDAERIAVDEGTHPSPSPRRIQRKRTKGWKMPEGAISVTRPTFYGNPFCVGGHFQAGRRGGWMRAYKPQPSFTTIETNEQAVEWFRRLTETWGPEHIARIWRDLRGHDLACWCPLDQPCHADILLALANPEQNP